MFLLYIVCLYLFHYVELNQNEDQCIKLLLKLIEQLPAPNKSTLEVLMTHLCLYVGVLMHANNCSCRCNILAILKMPLNFYD